MKSVSTGKSLPEEVRLRMELGERRQQFDGGSWTNEKHICFLNWMEASFVKKMRGNDAKDDGHLPLDRNLPDGSDSTLDFQSRRRNVNGKRPQANSQIGATIAKEERRTRRGYFPRGNDSPDQVVPQLECMK